MTDTILGDLNGYSSLILGSATAGNMDINSAVSFAKPVTFITGSSGNITLDHQITDSASGASGPAVVVLVSGQNVVNDIGSSVINLTGPSSPRWLAYSASPTSDTPNSLAGTNSVYGQTYGSDPPGSVSQSGNTWIYSTSSLGTLEVTANAQGIGYGNVISTLTYSCTGSVCGGLTVR